jgi:hypothetical protein
MKVKELMDKTPEEISDIWLQVGSHSSPFLSFLFSALSLGSDPALFLYCPARCLTVPQRPLQEQGGQRDDSTGVRNLPGKGEREVR